MSRITNTNNENFKKDVLESSLPVLVYFYSDDCIPCLMLEPMLERLAQQYEKNMRFKRIYRQQNRQLAEKYNVRTSPTLLFFKNGEEVCTRLVGYIGKQELKETIEEVIEGTCIGKERQKVYCDVLILGGGPAGLSAAIYTARAKLFTIVLEQALIGGQVATTFLVANYPGTNGVVRGIDLMENMRKQALNSGARIDDMKEIEEVSFEGDYRFVKSEDTDYYSKSVIIATGAQPRKLPAAGEREFRGRGVHYCATCDGALYQDADVVVVGGGNSAVEGAVFLTRYARHVTIIHQLDHFQASKTAQEEVFRNGNIEVIWDSEVREIRGDSFVRSVVIENLKSKKKKEIKADALFVYIGMEPETELFKGKMDIDPDGYIPVNEDMMTNVPGVFAAGDVRAKKVRQIATAVSDGVIAGIMAERYINGK